MQDSRDQKADTTASGQKQHMIVHAQIESSAIGSVDQNRSRAMRVLPSAVIHQSFGHTGLSADIDDHLLMTCSVWLGNACYSEWMSIDSFKHCFKGEIKGNKRLERLAFDEIEKVVLSWSPAFFWVNVDGEFEHVGRANLVGSCVIHQIRVCYNGKSIP